MNKLHLLSLSFLLSVSAPAFSQIQGLEVVKVAEAHSQNKLEKIEIPDVGGYKALICDFHTHTIFSDGSITPEERVWEAQRRGLDAVAITEHIEFRPHSDYITADHNKSFEIANGVAKYAGVLVIPGAEITREKPLGHLNALFLKDANPLDVDDPLKAIDKAVKQGAFIMWNHPGWPNDSSTIYDVHKQLIRENKIHGVELVNGHEYYPKAFNYCQDYNLTYMGNTDIHGNYCLTYNTAKQYGPVNIVLAKERSIESIKEALFQRRSIAKFGDLLISSQPNLSALLKACLPFTVEPVNAEQARVKVKNQSSLNFELQLETKVITIKGQDYVEFMIRPNEKVKVNNMYITDTEQLTFNFPDRP